LGVVKDRGQHLKSEQTLESVKDRIKEQLECLQDSEYLYFDPKDKKWCRRSIVLEKSDQRRYLEIASKKIDFKSIIYDDLDHVLGDLVQEDSICDVSGILKEYLIDVYIILSRRKVENIKVFELRLPRRLYDERELIHNLSLDRGDYLYVSMTKSPYSRDIIVKYESQERVDRLQVLKVDKLVDIVASRFAQFILILYGVLALILFYFTVRSVMQGGWDKLEPWTFLLFAFFPYIISLAALIIFKKEFSLKPIYLYRVLKAYRLKTLRKQWNSGILRQPR
jgi:hypothetical protein